jgi:GNAT superfamily N-acetyltransferase
MDPETLVAASHQNFIGSFRLLAEHMQGAAIYDGHGVFAYATGIGSPMFNGCIALEGASEEAFGSAVGWLLGRGVPCSVWVHEPAAARLGGVASACGLERLEQPYPGMALHPIPASPAAPEGVEIAVVGETGEADLIAAQAKLGRTEDVVRRLLGRSFRTDPDVRLFVARLDGDPVGASLAIRTGDVTGVYAVGTAQAARRRGVGTAATWAAIDAAREWDTPTVVLQSSSMGLSVYRAMGFEVVASYATFARRPKA